MKKFIILAALLCCQAASAHQTNTPRIVNGDELAGEEGQFFVALMEPFSWSGNGGGEHWNPLCGGVYLGDGLVLTAAHCVEVIPEGATFAALIGNPNATRNSVGDSYMQYEYCTDPSASGNPICKTAPSDGLSNVGDFEGFFYTGYLAYTGDEQLEVTKSDSTVLIHPDYRGLSTGNDLALIKFKVPAIDPVHIGLPDTDIFRVGDTYKVIGMGDTLIDSCRRAR